MVTYYVGVLFEFAYLTQERLQCFTDLGHVYTGLHGALRLRSAAFPSRPVSPGVPPAGNTHPHPCHATHTGHG